MTGSHLKTRGTIHLEDGSHSRWLISWWFEKAQKKKKTCPQKNPFPANINMKHKTIDNHIGNNVL